MKLKWVNHPSIPTKNGTFEHVNNTFGEVAIGYGQAERCPPPNYGTKEFHEERLEMARRAVPQPGDVDPNVVGVQWGIKERTLGFPSSKTHIVKRVGAETFRFDAPPADCPASIRARFNQLIAAEHGPAHKDVLERLQQEQWEREQKERQATVGITHQPTVPSIPFI
jgi:hypothetical protein